MVSPEFLNVKNNLFDISGKVVIITGGSGVLGGAMADYLLAAGGKVVIIGRSKEKVMRTVDRLKKLRPDQVMGHSGDVLDQDFLKLVKDEVLKIWNRIDVLINAAGGNLPGATIGVNETIFDLKIDDFQKVAQLNLEGSVLPSLVFGEHMAKNDKGCIINISSMAASQAITRVVGYSASKAAIDNFTKWMAVEMAKKFGDGLRVNAIAPGFFVSEQNKTLLLNDDGTYTTRGNTIISQTPMGRFGNTDELNGTVHWLISDASKFVTGTIIPVDGGFSAFSGV